MLRKTYVATVQILIHPNENVESKAEACDWFSALLTENIGVLDWGYLKVGGQYLYPSETHVDKKYQEGSFCDAKF